MYKFCILITVLITASACGNSDSNFELTNVTNWTSPLSIKTYDDYMAAACEKVKVGDSKTAMAMYLMAIQKAKSEYGPNDLRIATGASYLAAYCASLGLLGEAETYYKKALDIDLISLGAENSETVRVKNELADVLIKQSKVQEADELLHGAHLTTNKK